VRWARPFLAFLALFNTQLSDPLDQQKLAVLLQNDFDRIDPLTYAPWLLESTLPDSPPSRRLLMQIGIGDTAVPNLSAHLEARTLGVGHLQPAPRTIGGLEPVSSPHDGSAIVEFDFGIDPLPGIDAIAAGSDNQVHDGTRRLDAAREQLDRFLRPGGAVEHTCDGVCDPE